MPKKVIMHELIYTLDEMNSTSVINSLSTLSTYTYHFIYMDKIYKQKILNGRERTYQIACLQNTTSVSLLNWNQSHGL